jgi:hypothetical protein
MQNDKIPLAVDMKLLELGMSEYIQWKPERHPMMLVVGSTGSGKSYFLSLLMAKISAHIRNSELLLCDFKDIDFRGFADTPRRFSYENCMKGLQAFYDSFSQRLKGNDTTTHYKFLIFDEWAAFVVSRADKKAQDNVKNMLSTLLMMGRGVKHYVVIGLQRADATLFPLGGRDQFSVIMALGNLSKEQKQMLFTDYKEEITESNDRGQGYLYIDGDCLYRVVVPTVNNFDKLNAAIRDGLSR